MAPLHCTKGLEVCVGPGRSACPPTWLAAVEDDSEFCSGEELLAKSS